jgi:hypothetical protein
MPSDSHSHGGRRPHFHRGRRGHDRRGDRRPAQTQASSSVSEPSKGSDGIDVDRLVRDIRARIAQQHGIELSAAQIQELAARRLEAILDPRTVKPSLLEQLRQSAGASPQTAPVEPPPAFSFEDHTIFDTHNGLLRAMRSALKPVLKLFFNPNPIAHALNAQAKVNKEAAAREEARERTQREWNALHFTLVKQMATEVSRLSLESQSLALKVESLSTRVDFYERRVRAIENTAQPIAAAPQPSQGLRPTPPGAAPSAPGESAERRRRRRRRGRRGPGVGEGPTGALPDGAAGDDEPGDVDPTFPDGEADLPATASSASAGRDAGDAARDGGGPIQPADAAHPTEGTAPQESADAERADGT